MVLEQENSSTEINYLPTLPGEVIVWTGQMFLELQQEHGNLFVGEYSSGRPVINGNSALYMHSQNLNNGHPNHRAWYPPQFPLRTPAMSITGKAHAAFHTVWSDPKHPLAEVNFP